MNMKLIAVATTLAAMLTGCCSDARAHDWRRPDLNSWYGSLTRPGMPPGAANAGCCSKDDCHMTEADLRGGEWWARLGSRKINGDWELADWVRVPPDVVLHNHSNPTGEAVICHVVKLGRDGKLETKDISVRCFVPASES